MISPTGNNRLRKILFFLAIVTTVLLNFHGRLFKTAYVDLVSLLSNDALFLTRTTNKTAQMYEDKSTSSLAHTRIEIFYNVFVGRKDPDNAIRIVKQQLQQVSSSLLAKEVQNITVNYFHVGVLGASVFNKTFMDHLCFDLKLNCVPLGYKPRAMEEMALWRMHQFCKSHKDYQVIYLHDKGSFHPSVSNDLWRRHLTSAAISMDCMQAIQSTEKLSTAPSCNICGLSYTHPFFTGNMFAADCSYVAELSHPRLFNGNQHNVHNELKAMNFTHGEYTFRSGQDWLKGTRRYSCEHWVGTHPDIMPCDVQGNHEWGHWIRGDSENSSYSIPRAPRVKLEDEFGKSNQTTVGNLTFSRLTADLYRYYYLFRKVPPLDSWMFDYFSDGPFWRMILSKHDTSIFKKENFSRFLENASALSV